jgi:hypothetical protein
MVHVHYNDNFDKLFLDDDLFQNHIYLLLDQNPIEDL